MVFDLRRYRNNTVNSAIESIVWINLTYGNRVYIENAD
jgi:hypothetical protein